MAAGNALPFPLYGQAYRIPVAFRDTSGNLLTGWTGAAANAYPDNGTGSTCTIAESPANSGIGYIDLTATQMSCSMVTVVATITNANMTAYVAAIQVLNMQQFNGRWDAQSIQRLEQLFIDLYVGLALNGASQTGAAMVMNNPDGSSHFSGTITENTTSAVRSKMA